MHEMPGRDESRRVTAMGTRRTAGQAAGRERPAGVLFVAGGGRVLVARG
jgi:hypothetical protein